MERQVVIAVAGLTVAACASYAGMPGDSCGSDGDCMLGTICAVVDVHDGNERLECVASCEPGIVPPGRCSGGELCWFVRGDRLDVWGCFPGNDVPIGGSCTYPTGCVRGAMCELSDESSGVCVPVCNAHRCGLLEPCHYLVDCAEGLTCVALDDAGSGVCIAECSSPAPSVPSLCDDGSVCWELLGGGAACFPGGTLAIGAACDPASPVECARGSICAGDPPVCTRVCDASADCDPGASCTDGLCSG